MELNNKFSKSEELANAISHLFAAFLAVAGLVVMIRHSLIYGNDLHIVSTAVFGASMVILYFSSAVAHMLPMGKVKDYFFNLDRIAIYLLIAGTYTPLALVTLGGTLGWAIFAIEWGFALAGTLIILLKPGDFNAGVNSFYVFSYVFMGWLILIAIVPITRILPVTGWFLIILGGCFYSIGIIFYKISKFPYHHLVWHLMVIAGSACHFSTIFFFVIPR